LCCFLLRNSVRTLVIDLKPSQTYNTLTKRGFKFISRADEFLKYKNNKKIKLIYRPIRLDLNDLDRVLKYAYACGNIRIVFDEIYISKPYFISETTMFLLRWGRERKVSVWAGTQICTRINANYISQADAFVIFRMRNSTDRLRFRAILGDEYDKIIAQLRRFEFLFFSDSSAYVMQLDARAQKLRTIRRIE